MGWSSNAAAEPKALSVSIEQFARLWGPLYAISGNEGFAELVALNTLGGMVYRSSPADTARCPEVLEDEVLMHWTATGPVYKALEADGTVCTKLTLCSQSGEKLPVNNPVDLV